MISIDDLQSTTHFTDSVGMPPAFEIGGEKFIDNGFGQCYVDKPSRNAHDVGIVMLPDKGSQFFLPADSGTDTLVFIGCNGHTIRTAANQYAPIKLTALHGHGYRMCKVGIIDRVVGMSAKTSYRIARAFQEVHQLGLVGKASMVSPNGYGMWCIHSQYFMVVLLVFLLLYKNPGRLSSVSCAPAMQR